MSETGGGSDQSMTSHLQLRDLRERLDAALRRIEALELEVVRLSQPQQPSREANEAMLATARAVSEAERAMTAPQCAHEWGLPEGSFDNYRRCKQCSEWRRFGDGGAISIGGLKP